MTYFHRTLVVAAALGLAAAPEAQDRQVDADEPGAIRSAVRVAPSAPVDDRDPGAVRLQARRSVAAVDVSDADADAPLLDTGVRSAPGAAISAPLEDGRSDGIPVAARAVTVADGPLDDGRDGAAASLQARAVEAYDGPLDDGRPLGTRPAPVVAEAEAVVADNAVEALADVESAGAMSIEVVRPNPTPGRAEIAFRTEASSARVAVYDLRGRLVRLAYEGPTDIGSTMRVAVDLSDVASGTYLVVVDAGGARTSRPLQVVR